jgi:hypothetical protein
LSTNCPIDIDLLWTYGERRHRRPTRQRYVLGRIRVKPTH